MLISGLGGRGAESTLAMLSNPMEMAAYMQAQGMSGDEIEAAMEGDGAVMQKMLEKDLLGLPIATERLQEDVRKVTLTRGEGVLAYAVPVCTQGLSQLKGRKKDSSTHAHGLLPTHPARTLTAAAIQPRGKRRVPPPVRCHCPAHDAACIASPPRPRPSHPQAPPPRVLPLLLRESCRSRGRAAGGVAVQVEALSEALDSLGVTSSAVKPTEKKAPSTAFSFDTKNTKAKPTPPAPPPVAPAPVVTAPATPTPAPAAGAAGGNATHRVSSDL
jgi:hypothetical protein